MKKTEILNRIAVSLERIANKLEQVSAQSLNEITEGNTFSSVSDNCTNNDNNNETNDKSIKIDFKNTPNIYKHLNKYNISIKDFPPQNTDESIVKLAIFIGDKFEFIQKLFNRIKQHLDKTKSNSFQLKMSDGFTQEEIAYSCQLCSILHNLSFLSEYNYFKSPKCIIYATVNPYPAILNFLSGGWFELYIKEKIKQSCEQFNITDYEIINNLKIVFADGNDFELDTLFYCNNQLYWIEAKTGNYQNYIGKYSNLLDKIGVNKNNMILVVSNVNSDICLTLSNIYNISVLSLEQFRENLENIIQQKPIQNIPTTNTEKFNTLYKFTQIARNEINKEENS